MRDPVFLLRLDASKITQHESISDSSRYLLLTNHALCNSSHLSKSGFGVHSFKPQPSISAIAHPPSSFNHPSAPAEHSHTPAAYPHTIRCNSRRSTRTSSGSSSIRLGLLQISLINNTITYLRRYVGGEEDLPVAARACGSAVTAAGVSCGRAAAVAGSSTEPSPSLSRSISAGFPGCGCEVVGPVFEVLSLLLLFTTFFSACRVATLTFSPLATRLWYFYRRVSERYVRTRAQGLMDVYVPGILGRLRSTI